MKTKNVTGIIATFLFFNNLALADEKYILDNSHTTIGFSVSHMVINNVSGTFNDHRGHLRLNDKGRLIGAEATIATASVDTEIQSRDDHLRSPDFFDVEQYPEMRFKSTSVRKRIGKDALIGLLTIKGVTKKVMLKYTVKGPIMDPWGNKRVGFEARTVIKRTDFGLKWNQFLENGGLLVGEEVEITINLEAMASE